MGSGLELVSGRGIEHVTWLPRKMDLGGRVSVHIRDAGDVERGLPSPKQRRDRRYERLRLPRRQADEGRKGIQKMFILRETGMACGMLRVLCR